MLDLELKVPPVAVALVVAGLMWATSAVAPPLAVPVTIRVCMAGAFAMCGVAVIVAAVVGFRRACTTVNPLRPGHTARLVTTGAYGFSRNPMYLGLLFLLLGWAVVLASLLSLGLAGVLVPYLNRFQIRAEERTLSALFRQDYGDYMRQVRRWL